MQVTAAPRFFNAVGSMAGRALKGGPAMASVVSSALLGTTLGSAGANVAITGAFTIPMMKKAGYAESTIETTSQRLRQLAKHCDLNEPESVKECIASKECTHAYKSGLVDCYDRYVRFNGLEWVKPFFRREDPIIQLQTHAHLKKRTVPFQIKRLAKNY